MSEEIYKKLLQQSENVQDELLSCMSNLNLLDMLTPNELGMTDAEIIIDRKKEVKTANKMVEAKEIFDYWINLFDKGEMNEEKLNELLVEFPWLSKKED